MAFYYCLPPIFSNFPRVLGLVEPGNCSIRDKIYWKGVHFWKRQYGTSKRFNIGVPTLTRFPQTRFPLMQFFSITTQRGISPRLSMIQGPVGDTENYFWPIIKGQLISKGLFAIFIWTTKRTKTFLFLPWVSWVRVPLKEIFFSLLNLFFLNAWWYI